MGAVLFFGGIILRGLGERLNGIQEVTGSIPVISTKFGQEKPAKPWLNSDKEVIQTYHG